MKTQKVNKWIPYVGIPLLCTGFFILNHGWLPMIEILNFEILIVFGYILTVQDLRTKSVPNLILLTMLAIWCMVQIPLVVSDFDRGLGNLISAVMGGAIGGGVFLLVYIISRHGLGAGDVKFMAIAGLYLGMNLVMSSMLIGSILSAITGIVLLCMKKISKKDEIPLVPFLYMGILLTIFFL